MKVKALTKCWYDGKEYMPDEEFEHPDGAELRASIAVGKVKLADEQQPMTTENTEPLAPPPYRE